MFQRKIKFTKGYLDEKIIDQVRIYYFNIKIYDKIKLFQDSKEKEKLLSIINDDFVSFYEKYKSAPQMELAKLLEPDVIILPVRNSPKDFIHIRKILLKLNKSYKTKILNKSKSSITKFWLDTLKESIINFIKWVPTTIFITGIIKASIISFVLETKISFIFSIQDYWDYGITESWFLLMYSGMLFLGVFSLFMLSEYSSFNYIERAKIRYHVSSNEEKEPKSYLRYLLLGFVACYLLPKYIPNYIEYIYLFFFFCLFLLAIDIFSRLFTHTENLFITFSVICIVISILNNTWLYPRIVKHPDLFTPSELNIVHDVELPETAKYIESSSKYHIYSTGDQIFLIPTEEVQLVTKSL